MANQARFDLNAAFENWRNELAAQPNLTLDDRRELETHLRDAIADFQQRGLNDEEAFWLACRRVGRPQMLSEEFEKTDSLAVWRERAFWIVASLVVLHIWGSISLFVVQILFAPFHAYFQQPVNFNIEAGTVFYLLPVVWVMILIAKGRLSRLFLRLSVFFNSQLRLAVVGGFLVTFSSLLVGLADWIRFRSIHTVASKPSLFILNSLPALIEIGLLVWLMPQNRKAPKRV